MIRKALGVVAVLILVLTGTGWWQVYRAVGGITVSGALGALGISAPQSSAGQMNILLIGLDSRKDQKGDDLPQELLDKLHAGDSGSGGYNTNTLILVHVSADDRVTAFSIPRDDYVDVDGIVPGYSKAKIKEAYGLTKADAENTLVNEGVGDQETLESKGREAGRAATLKAVQRLTGAPIDYFAEVNLAGFYDLADSLGGVQVCLNSAVSDDYSGARFPAGTQTLNAAQALQFVRQRHGLDNGDLDRTHRQQAFLISVLHQLQDSGSLTDLRKLQSLIAVAHKDIVLSDGWGEDLFRRIAGLAGAPVEFRTLPVLRYDNVDGEDVNVIDAAAIKTQVAAAFGNGQGALPDFTAVATSTVDVINAGSTPGLAATVADTLRSNGFTVGDVRNATAQDPTDTAVDGGSGTIGDIHTVSDLVGIAAAPPPNDAVMAGHIRIVLGADYAPPAPVADSESTPAGAERASGTPDPGKPIDNAQIPCVD